MTQEPLSQSFKYQNWLRHVQANGLSVHGVEEVYTRHRYNGEALFGLVLLDASTPEGDKIPPICFIKGQVVSVLICLIDQDTEEEFLLLVRQRRICNGDYIYEHVAGMVDRDDAPHTVAVRETEEETGLKVDPSAVHPLNHEPLYASSGTSDEALYFFYAELRMSRAEIEALQDQEQGVDYVHERIYTHIATIPEALRLITNTNGLLNVYLYLEKGMRGRGEDVKM